MKAISLSRAVSVYGQTDVQTRLQHLTQATCAMTHDFMRLRQTSFRDCVDAVTFAMNSEHLMIFWATGWWVAS